MTHTDTHSLSILRIDEPGLETSIQDLGRTGLRHLGIPLGGAADRQSAIFANLALGNDPCVTVLESSLLPVTFQMLANTELAVFGALREITVNGEAYQMNSVIAVRQDDQVRLGRVRHGLRSYCAVSNGFSGEKFLGSSATMPDLGKGGFKGRFLKTGDVLRQNLATGNRHRPQNLSNFQPGHGSIWVFRLLPGPDFFDTKEDNRISDVQTTIAKTYFRALSSSNRMGVSLVPRDQGHFLTVNKGSISFDLAQSGPVYPGTVQIPSPDRLIVLGCDGQTTGGYFRLGQIISVDLPYIAQVRPNDHVCFRWVDHCEAQKILKQRLALLGDLGRLIYLT